MPMHDRLTDEIKYLTEEDAVGAINRYNADPAREDDKLRATMTTCGPPGHKPGDEVKLAYAIMIRNTVTRGSPGFWHETV